MQLYMSLEFAKKKNSRRVFFPHTESTCPSGHLVKDGRSSNVIVKHVLKFLQAIFKIFK